ncbi:MAG: hypothetical protein DRO05_02380 [Thermoproteota archaeon]|nr:MAG: hypothetical protein DRO05_02380 [Candidatus Korarchaeota archaeon]
MRSTNNETLLREGIPGDFPFIDSLHKEEGHALGFIPKGVYLSVLEKRRIDQRDRWKYSKIYITEDNGEQTGYCYVSFHGEMAKVFQIVVRKDARRWYRATLMLSRVEEEAMRRGKKGVEARVAIDLESNLFWRAMGYEPIKVLTSTWLNQRESKSKRPLFLYQKLFLPLFQQGQKTTEKEIEQ